MLNLLQAQQLNQSPKLELVEDQAGVAVEKCVYY